MGMYTIGNRVYVRAEIVAINQTDDTKYTVKTNSAKFYIKENQDIIHVDPEQDILTATELYNIINIINKMNVNDIQYMFTLYNNTHGTEYSNLNSLSDILNSGMEYSTIAEIYKYYRNNLEAGVGDLVKVIFSSSEPPIYGAVLHIDNPGEDNAEFLIYDADKDSIYEITKNEAQIIRYPVDDKENVPIESLFKNIKDIIANVTGNIDRG
jgi:hypothetical protein